MQHYKIILAYDGTEYHGWQNQKDRPSIAQALHKSFLKIFNYPMQVRAVSRTDAGVHALGQIVHMRTPLKLNAQQLQHAWAGRLPSDLLIRSVELVNSDFNPHANVTYKTYWYHLFLERPLPFIHRYGWYFRYAMDIDKLRQTLRVFEGTHDFRSFCTGNDRENTIRTILGTSVEYIPEYTVYRIAISGPKFLRYMIRRVVGASIEIASRKQLAPEDARIILAAKNPRHTLPKAPAQGLLLYDVVYK